MELFSADASVFKNNFDPGKVKKGPQKLLIIGPDPFISQSSPDHSSQPRIDFSYYAILGPDICSLICDSNTWERLKNPGNHTGIQPTLPLGLAAAAGTTAATAFLACWPAAAV